MSLQIGLQMAENESCDLALDDKAIACKHPPTRDPKTLNGSTKKSLILILDE